MNQLTFQDVLQTQVSPYFKLGQRAMTPDGRMWVYVKASSAFTKGKVAIPSTNVAVSNCSSSTDAIGRIVYITKASAGWTVGAYEDQLVYVSAGTGIGQFAKIQTNSTDTLTLYPENALTTALSVSDSAIVIMLNSLVVPSAVTSKVQKAVACAQIAFAQNDYGWMLTEGDGVVLTGTTTLVVGKNFTTGGGSVTGSVIVGVTTDGSFDAQNLGFCLVANTANDTLTPVRFEIRG